MNKDKQSPKITRKKRFNLLLTEEEYHFLNKISLIENKPISEILRNAVDFLYHSENKENIIKNLELIYNKSYINYDENLKEFINFYLK